MFGAAVAAQATRNVTGADAHRDCGTPSPHPYSSTVHALLDRGAVRPEARVLVTETTIKKARCRSCCHVPCRCFRQGPSLTRAPKIKLADECAGAKVLPER